jgi:hypothetical protein
MKQVHLALALCAGMAGSALAQCPTAPAVEQDFGVLTSGVPVFGSTTLTSNEVHWFKFTLAAPVEMGALTFLNIDTFDASADTEIGVYDCSGNLMATDDDDGPGVDSAMSFGSGDATQLDSGSVWSNGRDGRLAAGDYYLAVVRFSATFGLTDFIVTSTATTGGTSPVNLLIGSTIAQAEPSGTLDLGTMSATDTRAVMNETLNAGEVRWYKVSVPAANLATNRFLDIDTEGSALSPTNATRIAVYNVTGAITGTLNPNTRLNATTGLTDATDGTDSMSQISLGVGIRTAPGNGLLYNGRDGNLQAGTYLIGVAGPGTAPIGTSAVSGGNFGFASTSANVGTFNLNLRTGAGEIPLVGAPMASVPTSVNNCGSATSLLRVNVTPANSPPGPSTGIAVSADLSAIGGSSTQQFFDDGSNGDVTPGDNIFSFLATVASTTAVQAHSMPFSVTDLEGRSANGNVALTVTLCPPPGDLCTNPLPVTMGSTAFTTTGLGANLSTTCGGTGEDIFFVFTPTTSGPYMFSVCGATFNTVIALRSDCSTQIACDDNGCGDGLTSMLIAEMFAGVPVIVQVDGFGGADGSGTLVILDNFPLGVIGATVTGAELTTPHLRATVTPGNPPLSTGVVVRADLSSVGGSSTQQLFDDGSNGDVTPFDNIYSFAYTLPASVITGGYPLPVSSSDDQLRTATGTITLNVTNGPSGACCSGSSCTIERQTICFTSGGFFQGTGSNCAGQGYTFGATTAPFIDLSATGTVLATVSTCDDCTESITLPFGFNHMGNTYFSANVSSNGNIQFSTNSTAFTNVNIPATAVPNDMLCPAWDDYDTDEASAGQGTVYYLDESATNNRVIISWQDCSQFNNAILDSNNFQVLLYSNGNVEFRYGNMNNILNPSVANDIVTIGYENLDGTFGGQYDSMTVGAGNVSVFLTAGIVPSPCGGGGPTCDSIDYNNDGLFPDTLDIDDFIAVFQGSPCSNDPNCGDLDFNNDGLFPDTLDLEALISVFQGGPCL